MQILILRHGEAGHHAVDAQRALTARGQAEIQRVADQLSQDGVKPDVIWHSPYRRAQESARILGDRVGGVLETQSTITPDGDPGAVIEQLQAIASDGLTLALVSHMPFVNELTGLLVEGSPGGFPFATGEARVIECDFPSVSCSLSLKSFQP